MKIAGDVRQADRLAFYAARFVSQGGQALYLAALLVAAGTGKSAPLALSSVFAATLAAGVLFGLPGGAIADRLGAARGFALGALLRFTVIACGLILIGHPSLAWLVAFAYSATSQIFSPAEMALVPAVQARAPARAHTALVVLQYAGQGAGALLAPILLLLGGPRLALAGAAVAYLALSGITTILVVRLRRLSTSGITPTRRVFSFGEPFRFIAREPRARYAVGLLVFTDIMTKGAVIAAPHYLQSDLGFGRWAVAALMTAGGVGAALGLLWTSRVRSARGASRTVRLGFMGAVAGILTLISLGQVLGEATERSGVGLIIRLGASSNTSLAVAFLLAFLLGLCITAGPIGARALLTQLAPAGQQARVFALQTTLTHAFTILPLLFAGIGAQYAGPRASLAFVGGLGVAALLSLEAARLRQRTPFPSLAAVEISGG